MTQKEYNDKRNTLHVKSSGLEVQVAEHAAAIADLRVQVKRMDLDSVLLYTEYETDANTMSEREFFDKRNTLGVQCSVLQVEMVKHEAAIADLKVQIEQLGLDIVTLRSEYEKSRPTAPVNCTYATTEDTVHAE